MDTKQRITKKQKLQNSENGKTADNKTGKTEERNYKTAPTKKQRKYITTNGTKQRILQIPNRSGQQGRAGFGPGLSGRLDPNPVNPSPNPNPVNPSPNPNSV